MPVLFTPIIPHPGHQYNTIYSIAQFPYHDLGSVSPFVLRPTAVHTAAAALISPPAAETFIISIERSRQHILSTASLGWLHETHAVNVIAQIQHPHFR